jgi:hypothetical protein
MGDHGRARSIGALLGAVEDLLDAAPRDAKVSSDCRESSARRVHVHHRLGPIGERSRQRQARERILGPEAPFRQCPMQVRHALWANIGHSEKVLLGEGAARFLFGTHVHEHPLPAAASQVAEPQVVEGIRDPLRNVASGVSVEGHLRSGGGDGHEGGHIPVANEGEPPVADHRHGRLRVRLVCRLRHRLRVRGGRHGPHLRHARCRRGQTDVAGAEDPAADPVRHLSLGEECLAMSITNQLLTVSGVSSGVTRIVTTNPPTYKQIGYPQSSVSCAAGASDRRVGPAVGPGSLRCFT